VTQPAIDGLDWQFENLTTKEDVKTLYSECFGPFVTADLVLLTLLR